MATGIHWCDCALYNEPAIPNGPCNCGADAPAKEEKQSDKKEDKLEFSRVAKDLRLACV